MICTLSTTLHRLTQKHLCWHSITKILRNGPRAHFPFNHDSGAHRSRLDARSGRRRLLYLGRMGENRQIRSSGPAMRSPFTSCASYGVVLLRGGRDPPAVTLSWMGWAHTALTQQNAACIQRQQQWWIHFSHSLFSL
jgi:hypothetical protein